MGDEMTSEKVFTWYEPPTRPGVPGLCGPGGDQMCSEVMLHPAQQALAHAAEASKGRSRHGDGTHPGGPKEFRLFHIPQNEEPNRWPELEKISKTMNDEFARLSKDALERQRKVPGFEKAEIMIFARNAGLHLVFAVEDPDKGHGNPIDIEANAKKMKNGHGAGQGRGAPQATPPSR